MPYMQEKGTVHSDNGGGPLERESPALLYKIFHASPSLMSVSGLADGRLIDVNEEWSTFTGYSIEDVVGRTIDDLGLWDDPSRYADIRRTLLESGSVHDEEIVVRTRSNELRTVVLSAQLIEVQDQEAVLKVMTDITDRKRTLRALRESEERFHILADSAPVLIWMADDAGAVEHVNRTWTEFTGAGVSEHLERGWRAFVHPDDRVSCETVYREAVQKQAAFSREYRLRRHDGTYRWVLDQAVPRYNPEGSFTGYIGSCSDVQEQKETHQALLEAKEHAEEMSSLKATFLTNITHEIRTPLTVILGFTSMLRQGVRPEYHRFVKLIERSGRRLLLMLDSMLDLAQLEAGTLEVDQHPHNVADVVEGVAALVRPIADEKGLDLEVRSPQGRQAAKVDYVILTRVVNNLLDNAVKFTDSGRVTIDVEREGAEIRIVICDTGVGIEEEFLGHVFDPFVQESTGLDRTHQGSGLGLSVSKRLIELMGGTIRLDSEKGQGSVFTIILPAAD